MQDNYLAKIAPSAIQLEEAVLGAILTDKDSMIEVTDILTPSMFYLGSHKIVFSAIQEMFNKNKSIDLLTVTEYLRKKNDLENCGGPYFVTCLTNGVASGANILEHALIIKQKWFRREIIDTSLKSITNAYDDTKDDLDTLYEHVKRIEQLADKGVNFECSKVSDIIKDISKPKNLKTGGVELRFPSLCERLKKLTEPDLIILAARPGMGKTSAMLQIAIEAAEDGYPVGIFSLEMSKEQLVIKMISMLSGLSFDNCSNFIFHDGDYELYISAMNRVNDLPIYIDDSPNISDSILKNRIFKMRRRYGVELVCVDYIQLMHCQDIKKNSNREQEISGIARSLKNTAKLLKIPIIALSQLSRQVESRSDKKPMLSDLRESGEIEQAADIVLFLMRPEYYGINEYDGHNTNGMCLLDIAKFRNGKTGTDKITFLANNTYFENFIDFGSPKPRSFNSLNNSPF